MAVEQHGVDLLPVVALLGPTLPERSKPWRDPRYYVETIDHALPCRPCHQRVCEPGEHGLDRRLDDKAVGNVGRHLSR